MACFDTGQAAISGTTPVPLFTVDSPGPKNIVLLTSVSSGSVYVGNSPTVSSTTGFLVPSGFPFSFNATAGRGTTLYAVSNGGSGTIFWMVGQ